MAHFFQPMMSGSVLKSDTPPLSEEVPQEAVLLYTEFKQNGGKTMDQVAAQGEEGG